MKKLVSLLSLIVFFPFLAFAQSAGQGNSQNVAPSAIQSQSSGTAQNVSIADLQKIIQDLMKQVQSLQQQISALQGGLGKQQELSASTSTTTAETSAVTSTPAFSPTPETSSEEEVLPLEFKRPLSRGSSGDDVRKLQELLSKDKEIYPEGLVTGYFGFRTEIAVKKWQEKHGIESVGVVGPKTIAKFQELGRGVIQGLIQQGAGLSGVLPPGLLTAPGIQGKLGIAATTTIIQTTTTTSQATTTPSGTTPAIPAIPAQPSQGTGGFTIPAEPAIPAVPAATSTTATSTDTVAPSAPTNLTATAVSSIQVNLFWTGSTDNVGIAGYKIYRNGSLIFSIATTTVAAPSGGQTVNYSATNLSPSTVYSFTVAAYDAAGNTSAQSASASATTQAALSHSCGTPVNVPQDASSIQAGLNTACSGDTVFVSAGTYRENITVPRSQLTLKGASGTTPEQVIIDGGGIADVVYAKAVSDFVIDGFTLQNASQNGSMPGGGGLFINGNVCCSFNAGNTIARNLIIKSNSHGVVVWNVHAGSISLERNLIVGNLYSGIDASSPISSGQMIMTNNTIAKNSRDGYYDWAGGGSRTFRNNIIVSNGRYGVYSNQYTTKYASYDDVWGNTQRDYCNAEPYGSCITSYTPSPGTGELSVDPKFVSSSDYHLQSTSPVINAGDPSSQYNDSNGTRNDMGAYPFVGSTATTTAADTTAPSAPNVSYIIHSTQVDLSWAPSTDNVGVAGYRINRGGSLLVTLATTTTGATISYYDAGLSPSTTYSYVVTAYDAAGNVSLPNSANITTLGGTTADTTPPSAPTNLLAVASSSSQINLSWTASTDNVGVAGYKIYRGSLLLASWSGTSYSDVGTFPSLSPSTSYTYTVAAYDAAGNVSSQSSPASATTPAALLAPTAVSSEFGVGWPGQYEQSIRFGYPSSGISQISSFRLYEKKPNDAAFNLVETFANVAPLAANCSGVLYGAAWNLSYTCSAGFWDAHSKSTHTSSFFQVGEYDYYVTAIDSSGAESAHSPTLKEYVLQPVEITSPTSAQSPTALAPTIRWNAVSGWPSSFTPPYYIQVSEEGALTSYMSPVYTASVSVTSGSTSGSKVYAGPALDPAKKYIVEIYGSTSSQGASYMAMVKDLQTFWVASSTASGAPGSSLADLLESLRSLVAALQKLQSSAR